MTVIQDVKEVTKRLLSSSSLEIQQLSLEDAFMKAQKYVAEFQFADNYSESLQRFRDLFPDDRFDVILSGVTSLKLFVALNWTGYKLQSDPFLLNCLKDVSNKDILLTEGLDTEGEGLYPVCRHIELLLFARLVLVDGTMHFSETSWILEFWRLRCLSIQRQCLTEKSEHIRCQGIQSIQRIEDILECDSDINDDAKTLFYLESVHFFAEYHDLNKMKTFYEKASDCTGVKTERTGVLGKRTKFQQSNVAQYTLNIHVDNPAKVPTKRKHIIPEDLRLNDEVRLNEIEFAELGASQLYLSPIQRAVILTEFIVVFKSQPRDALTLEEVLPYLEVVLRDNDVWSLQISALLLRSVLQSRDRRTVERALMQVELLVNDIDFNRDETRIDETFFASLLPPFWKVEAELVALFLSLGSTKSALDIALKIQLWEDVINCYHRLQLKHKAAEVIREQLAIKETPLLYCMLGDATDEIKHYQKALDMSEGKNARALRSLGYLFYFKKEYTIAIDYMKRSLELNGFQQQLLLRLSYTAMEIEDWETAASSYRKYCSYESDNFEAWNNLANVYVKMGQKARAWKVLQEAVKCDFDNWKVWDNIVVVSTDCAHFEEVIRAYNRVLDLKNEKHIDYQVLEILVRAIVQNLPDAYDRPTSKLQKPAAQLFGRLSSGSPGESKIWELYSELINGDPETKVDARDYKAATLLQKAVTAAIKVSSWEKKVDNIKNVLRLGHSLAEAGLRTASSSSNLKQSSQFLSSIRMTLKGIIVKIENAQLSPDDSYNKLIVEVKEDVKILHSKMNSLR